MITSKQHNYWRFELASFRAGGNYLDWYGHDNEYPYTRVWGVLPNEMFLKLGALKSLLRPSWSQNAIFQFYL